MSEDDNDDRERITQEEWNAFWKTLNHYQTSEALRREVFRQADEIWADVSPRLKASEQAYVGIQNGKFQGNMAGHVLIAALSNTIYQSTLNAIFNEEVLSQLSQELQSQVQKSDSMPSHQLRPEQECPSCGEVFDPEMSHCPNCGEEI